MLFAGTDQEFKDFAQEVGQADANRGQFGAEYQDRRKDGSTFWVSNILAAIRLGQPEEKQWLGIIRDITQRKRAEEMLTKAKDQLEATVQKRTAELRAINKQLMVEISDRETAQQLLQDRQTELSAIFDNAPVIITLIDPDGHVCMASRAASELSGRSVDEILGLSLGKALGCSYYLERVGDDKYVGSPECKTCLLRASLSRLSKLGGSDSIQVTLPFLQGHKRRDLTLLVSATCVHVSGKRFLLVCMEDISELTRTVQARADFVANASHQLRTPLTTMRAALEMLETQQPNHRLIQVLARHLMRLEKLTNDLLDLHLFDAGKVQVHSEPVNVALLCRELLEPYSRHIKQKGLQFDVQLPEGSIEVFMDGNLFSQVICNLVDNAMKFTDSGRVSVNAGVCDHQLILSVADTGCGIAKDQHDCIFERFYKQDNNFDPSAQQVSGTGLGLAMVNDAVAALGGSIRLDSELGSGSLFTVSIPVQQIS